MTSTTSIQIPETITGGATNIDTRAGYVDFEAGPVKVRVRQRSRSWVPPRYTAGGGRARGYYTMRESELWAKTRVYFDHEGEGVIAGFGNRNARPTDVYRKVWGRFVAETIGVPVTGLRWSQHAGCSMCPCSPGFVAPATWTVDGRPVDIWVTVGPETPPTTDPALAADRVDQLLADPTIAGALADVETIGEVFAR